MAARCRAISCSPGPITGTLRIPTNAPEQVDSVPMSGTVVSAPAAAAPRPTDWRPFQIFRATARHRRITLRLYSSLAARIIVSARLGRGRIVGGRVRTSIRSGFSTIVVRGRFVTHRTYRVHVLAHPTPGLRTNPTHYSLFRKVRVPR